MRQKLSCIVCAHALTESPNLHADDPHLQLILAKQQGGLLVPSKSVWKLVNRSERAFCLLVAESSADITAKKNIGLLLFNTVMHQGQSYECFPDLSSHDIETASGAEEFHSTQLKKIICQHLISLRLYTHGQKYCKEHIQQHEVGQRQKLTKTTLFQNI